MPELNLSYKNPSISNNIKMGCSNSHLNPPVLIIPEEENYIHSIERYHPFAKIEANLLYQVIFPLGRAGTIQENDFTSVCNELKVPTESFTSPRSAYFRYWTSLKVHGVISAKLLLISSILLSNSLWQTKIKILLWIYESDANRISSSDLSFMMNEIIYVALNVTPSVETDKYSSPMNYLKSLNKYKNTLIQNFLAFLGNKNLYSTKYVIRKLYRHDLYQKILWSSGIRMVLMEEYLAISNGPSQEKPENLNSRPKEITETITVLDEIRID